MEKLLKPSEYAKILGISRQAVYAKIKKGLIKSKNVDGKLYVLVEENKSDTKEELDNQSENFQELIEAKDETISVLKATIEDLKETNKMITSTLRSEVELLKEAFGEMKALYAYQIEHIKQKDASLPLIAEIEESKTKEDNSQELKELEALEALDDKPKEAEEEIKEIEALERVDDEIEDLREEIEDRENLFVPLDEFLKEQDISDKKFRKKIIKKAKKLYKAGSSDIKIDNEQILITVDRASRILKKLIK